MRLLRLILASSALLAVQLAAAPSSPAAVTPKIAKCGRAVYGVSVAPASWDVGCTGGSPAATELKWAGWGAATTVGTGLVRRRYDTTGDIEDRIYPTWPGRVVLSRIRGTTCARGIPQYTTARIEWTVPEGFAYDSPGTKSATFTDLGPTCPVYELGASSDPDTYGYGSEKPSTFFTGNLSTRYFSMRWSRWGRSVARGTGKTYGPAPRYNQIVGGRVTASRMRRCGTLRYVYTRVTLFRRGSNRGTPITFTCDG